MVIPENTVGIYKITSPTGRVYIGKSSHMRSRYSKYKNSKCETQSKLYRSILKYGWNKHVFEIVELCERKDLNSRERHWQDEYNVIGEMGLNCILTKSDDKCGTLSQETKNKIGKALKGRPLSKETVIKIAIANTGKKRTPEQNKRNSEVRIGSKATDETKLKMSKARLGKSLSEETKSKISKARKGKPRPCFKGSNNPQYGKTGELSPNSKIILDLSTGIYYFSAKEAAFCYNFKPKTLQGWLANRYTNKSNLIYA